MDSKGSGEGGGEGRLGMKRQDNGSEGESTNTNNKITPTVKHFKSTGLERHLIKTIYGKKRTEKRADQYHFSYNKKKMTKEWVTSIPDWAALNFTSMVRIFNSCFNITFALINVNLI